MFTRFLKLKVTNQIISQVLASVLIISGFTISAFQSNADEPPPTVIKSVSPEKLPLTGGSLEITGDGFVNPNSITVVRLGSLQLSATEALSITANRITFNAPATATAGRTEIGVKVGDSAEVTAEILFSNYDPVVGSVSPSSGRVSGGNTITVEGEGFSPSDGAPVTLMIGAFSVTDFRVVSDTQITATVPTRAVNDLTVGAFKVKVTVGANDGAVTSSDSDDVYYSFAPELETIKPGLVTLGSLASRSQRKAITRVASGNEYLVSGTDSLSGQSYSYLTDFRYFGDRAYSYESDERAGSISTSSSAQSGTFSGRPSVTLASSGNCSGSNFFSGLETYCSVFGPEIFSETFYATAGKSLAFDWAAEGGQDDFEVYAFLVKVPDASTYPTSNIAHTLILHNLGHIRGWTTSAGVVPSDGLYRFRFVNGSYDASGGQALGSKMYLSPSVYVGDSNAISLGTSDPQIRKFGTVSIEASATSMRKVTFTSTTTGICSILSSTHDAATGKTTAEIKALSVGTCNLSVSQGAVGTYAPAPTLLRSITVIAAPIADVVTPTATYTGVRVTWSAVASATGYFLEYQEEGSETWIRENTATVVTRDLSVQNLSPAKRYAFRVIAFVGGIEETPSDPTSLVRPLIRPTTNVTAVAEILGASISWDLVTGALEYLISYSTNGGTSWEEVAESPVTTSPYVVQGLNPASAHVFRVRAKAGEAISTAVRSTPAISPLPVPAPTNLLAAPAILGATLSWTGSDKVTSYLVYYSTDGGQTWAPIGESPVSGSSVNVTGLTQANSYLFKVVAAIGSSLSSEALTTAAITPLSSRSPIGPAVPSPIPTPRPSSTPTPLLPVVLPTLGPTPSASPTTNVLSPELMIQTDPTPGVRYSASTPIPEFLADLLSSPLAYILSALSGDPELPELQPGDSLAYENGKPVQIELVVSDDGNGYVLRGDGWQVALEATDSSGEPLLMDDSGNIILNKDRFVQFSGSGFAPGSIVKVWLFSDPAELSDVVADASGNFVGQAQLPEGIPTGEHTVQLNGLTQDGQLRSVSLGVLVQPDPVAALPAPIGFDLSGLMNFLWLLATGILIFFFILWRRRRKKEQEQGSVGPAGSDSDLIFASEGFVSQTLLPDDSRRKIGPASPPNRKRFSFRTKGA